MSYLGFTAAAKAAAAVALLCNEVNVIKLNMSSRVGEKAPLNQKVISVDSKDAEKVC